MQVARVIGDVVATIKDAGLHSHKLLISQDHTTYLQTQTHNKVEDDTVVVVAMKPRRKISGDSQRCIERRHVTGTLRRAKAGIERRHRQRLAPTTRGRVSSPSNRRARSDDPAHRARAVRAAGAMTCLREGGTSA